MRSIAGATCRLPRLSRPCHPAAGERQVKRLVQIVQGRGLGGPGQYPAPLLGMRHETGLGERPQMLVDDCRRDAELGGERRRGSATRRAAAPAPARRSAPG